MALSCLDVATGLTNPLKLRGPSGRRNPPFARADYLVADAVPRNGSPADKFPANREKNREKSRNTAEKAEGRSSML
jgi:hypothetical protein